MELDIQVPAIYLPECKVVFVGDAPGKEENDAAEKCLQRACGIAGLDYRFAGRSNIVKRRYAKFYETIEEAVYTPTGKLSKRTKKVTRKTQEFTEWEDRLLGEFRRHKPNLIVATGNQALETLTGMEGITNYRGSILADKWGDKLKILATAHPRDIIWGDMLGFWILVYDLKKAKREMEFPEIKRETWAQNTNPGLAQTLWYFRRIAALGCKWTLDVETRAGTLACFSIAYWNGTQYETFCVPIQTTTGPYWNPAEEMEIWNALRETCKANASLCNQNIEYDIYYLLRYGVEPSGVWMDTMLAHSILYPEFPKGLDFLCSLYLDDVVYYKGEGRNWNAGDRDPQLWEYCCKDAVYTLRVVEKMDKELKRRGLFEVYHGTN